MKKIAFYAGSFDPFTNGHLELVKQASLIFDGVIIGIGINPDKKTRFDKEKMKVAIEETLHQEKLNNCQVIIYQNETWQAAKNNNSNILIRGLRNETDYQYEEQIAKYNDKHQINTIYLRANEMGHISSSFVYQELKNNQDISKYVPNPIKKLIMNKNNKY